MKPFLDTLKEDGILADGAIGTQIYANGIFINRSFDELNLSKPDLIKSIHEEYINAGSGLIETNTFTANRPSLTSYGLEDKVIEINRSGAEIAKKAAANNAYVAGAIGPVRWAIKSADFNPKDLEPIFEEQIKALCSGGVDVILFETFTDLEELHIAFNTAKKVCSLPIISQVSLNYIGEGEFEGIQPADAANTMSSWGSDVIGVNCCNGPQGVFEAVKIMSEEVNCPLSAMPNAGLPKMVQGRMMYLASPEYMAEYARRYAQLGISLIGGCCGTTPAHIKEMKRFLKPLHPTKRGVCKPVAKEISISHLTELAMDKKSELGKKINDKSFIISVEVDPPLGTNPKKAIAAAKYLKEIGVDAVNIADGPRAMARMSPMALASLIKDQIEIETIVHYCCRDRNLLGIQMDLIGGAALGLNNILIITGDPPKMGSYPEATPVFDIDAIGLIRFAKLLNQGLDLNERPISGQTNFLVGCGVNPGAIDINLEVERFHQKIDAGAEFAFSQPVYDANLLNAFLEKIKPLPNIHLVIGILPLASSSNAEFLHNEIPGMQIPNNIMKKMQNAPDKKTQQLEGVKIAKEAFSLLKNNSQVNGAYIFPPFGNYEAVAKIIE